MIDNEKVSTPDFSFEGKYWKQGFPFIIGIDEVGRGPLAGPVVTGVVTLKYKGVSIKYNGKKEKTSNSQNTKYNSQNTILKLGINDSKKLSANKRELLSKEIPKYFHVGIGKSSVGEINKFGIVKATEKAMERAIKYIGESIKYKGNKKNKSQNTKYCSQNTIYKPLYTKSVVLVDGLSIINNLPENKYIQEPIIKGDGKSISIAAASIMAKVYRDRLMVRLAKKYPDYGWEKNKGYGTRQHIEAIRKYGLTELHRKLFVRNVVSVQSANIMPRRQTGKDQKQV